MEPVLRILIVEDSEDDALLILHQIKKGGYEVEHERVESAEAMKEALKNKTWDIVLSDYKMPHFNGLEALAILKKSGIDIPFIVISGTIGEEIAVDSMKAGAYDYIMKNNMKRLLPAIERELREAKIRAERKRLEQKQMQAEANLHLQSMALESAANSIIITDKEGVILWANHAFSQLTGYSIEEVIGKTHRILKSGVQDMAFYENLWQTILSGTVWHNELVNRRKDGTTYTEEMTITPVHNGEKIITNFIAIKQNITDRKRAVEELRESEERYRRLFEEDLTGNYISLPNGKLISCNPAILKIFGFSSMEEALKTDITSYYNSSEERENFLFQIREKKKIKDFEHELRRSDGKIIYVIENAIGRFNTQGELVEIQGYIIDITEQKILQQQFIQAQKMESIGTLAGGIAHDFNNVLGIILAYTNRLQLGYQSPDKLARGLEVIEEAVERGANLVRQILTFARKTDVVYELIDANIMIKEFVKIMTETLPKTITISTNLDSHIPNITVDTTQFHQVLLNLCVNARDAMPKGGALTITTKLLPQSDVQAIISQASEKEYLRISISDTGMGMDDMTKDRIFEPFFTTKDKGKGTGLGLAVVYGIVKSHKGFITIESAMGQGSIFHLYFPVSVAQLQPSLETKHLVEEIKGGNETILVVEDEEQLVSFLKSLLEAKGYYVITAMDGVNALELYHRHKDEINLVVTDIGLPGISGDKIFQQLRQMNSALKVILASGYIEPEMKTELLEEGAEDFIQKPYRSVDVLMKIRNVLDEK